MIRAAYLATPGVYVLLAVSSCFAQQTFLGDPPIYPFDSSANLTGPQPAPIQESAEPCWYDTSNRMLVANAYNAMLAENRTAVMGWTGSFSPPNAGMTSSQYQNVVLHDLNWVRAMSGVPCLSGLDPIRSAADQQAAFMMMTNAAVSHTPPTSWLNWTQAGFDAAAKSDLCFGLLSDPGCVQQYMVDSGPNNDDAGHRRWILYPQTTVMGTGDVPGNGNLYQMANALWVIDTSTYNNPRPATREKFVAWPPSGYIPYQVVPVRWSFSYPGADFSGATVTMRRNGAPVTVSLRPISIGFGENTLVWVPDGQDPNSLPNNSSPGALDVTIKVTINNVLINGVAQSFNYLVVIFDPATDNSTPPTVDSANPGGGSGYSGVFTFKYSSPSGFEGLTDVFALFNSELSGTNGCVVFYDRDSNGFYLFNDAGDGATGPLTPGAAATLEGSQCILMGTGSSVNGSGKTLTLTLNVTFKKSFPGTQRMFLFAFSNGGANSGWQDRGTWTVPGGNLPPTADFVMPASGSGTSQSFTFQFSRSNGSGSLTYVHALISPTIDATKACWIVYDRASNGLLLANDSGFALMGPMVLGTNGKLQNSQCTINGAGSFATGNANTLTLVLNVNFAGTFSGAKRIYMNATNSAGMNSGWQDRGTWTVTSP